MVGGVGRGGESECGEEGEGAEAERVFHGGRFKRERGRESGGTNQS
jgi:hypothetical protein